MSVFVTLLFLCLVSVPRMPSSATSLVSGGKFEKFKSKKKTAADGATAAGGSATGAVGKLLQPQQKHSWKLRELLEKGGIRKRKGKGME